MEPTKKKLLVSPVPFCQGNHMPHSLLLFDQNCVFFHYNLSVPGDRFSEKEVRQSVVGFSTPVHLKHLKPCRVVKPLLSVFWLNSVQVLFCVLLPPIIFDSGFRMRGAFFWVQTSVGVFCSLCTFSAYGSLCWFANVP